MKVVYYSRPCFLDHVLPQAKVLSREVELHLFLELSPELQNSSLFDAAPALLTPGVIPAHPILERCFPAGVCAFWRDCAGFTLIVHDCRRTIHPRTWWLSHKAARSIVALKPDILHFDGVSTRMASSILELRKTPMILTVHDPQRHYGESNWRSIIPRRMSFRQARRFLLHSRSLRESLSSRYGIPPVRIDTVPLGVLDIFREWMDTPQPTDDNTVLFFGRLSAYKGLEVLYEAAPMVAEKVPNVRFLIAGRPVKGYRPPPPPVLPNDSRIEVISEYITNSRVAELFQSASVVACPYIDATQSGVVLTAYAFDKPVVTTNVGGMPEYVKHEETGLLVPPKDGKALADALVRVLSDTAFQCRLTEGVKKLREEELSWSSIGKKTMRIYEKTLNSSV